MPNTLIGRNATITISTDGKNWEELKGLMRTSNKKVPRGRLPATFVPPAPGVITAAQLRAMPSVIERQERRQKERYAAIIKTMPLSLMLKPKLRATMLAYVRVAVANLNDRQLERVVWPWQKPTQPRIPGVETMSQGRARRAARALGPKVARGKAR